MAGASASAGPAIRRDRRIAAGLCLWLVAVGAALIGLDRYKALAGSSAPAPDTWPEGTGIERAPGQPTLVAFAHPQCPCTRASLASLRALSHHFGRAVQARLLFEVPAGAGAEWTRGGLWEQARAIPGLAVAVDAEGRAARRFGAQTSGHVVLYDERGALVSSGGLTPARGHEGQNSGLTRIAAWLAGERAAQDELAASFPVFGCPLASGAR